jgi:protein TonB
MADNIIFKQSWLDLIFKDKNKAYGAYFLRRLYEKNVMIAVIAAATVFILAIAAPVITTYLFPDKVEEEYVVKKPKVTTYDAPPPDESKTPPPPPPPEPPKVEITKFLPPVPKPDEQVAEEIVTNKELEDDNVGDINQEGDKNLAMDAFEKVEVEEQTAVEIAPEDYDITEIQEMPEFPGGFAEMYKFISKNVTYPKIALKMGISGKVHVKFSVSADGTLSNVEILRGQEGGLNEEAIRLVKMMPKWTPGRMNGKAVKVRSVQIPVNFMLE